MALPVGLRPQLEAWYTYTAANLMLGKAFSIGVKEASEACTTLGGVEFSEVCGDLVEYATGIMLTFEKTASSMLKGYIVNTKLERTGENMAKYGGRLIKLRGGDAQYETMESAAAFLQQTSDALNSVDNANIASENDLRRWLAEQFSGKVYDERFQRIYDAAEKLLPFAQRAETKRLAADADKPVQRINTCLWSTLQSDEPFTVRTKDGSVLASDTLHASIEKGWPACIFVEASGLRLE